MDPDLMFVIGLVILVFSVPPIMGALSDGRAPRAASLMVLIGGGLLVTAIGQKPGGYALAEIPDVFISVVGRYLN